MLSKTRGFVDLIIVDVPEGLPVPGVSIPPKEIPSWNAKDPLFIEGATDLADNLLQDDGALILIHPIDSEIQVLIEENLKRTEMEIRKTWIGG